jgi:hypothetical protein
MPSSLPVVTVGIYNMLGECVLLDRFTGRSIYETDISGLPGGVYIVRATNGTGLAVLKVVKE